MALETFSIAESRFFLQQGSEREAFSLPWKNV